jgi:hypothetical protein
MGFNKLWVPAIEDLEKSKRKMGEHEFGMYWHKRLMKTDAIIGDSSSVEMIKQFAEKAYNVQKDNQKDKE